MKETVGSSKVAAFFYTLPKHPLAVQQLVFQIAMWDVCSASQEELILGYHDISDGADRRV